MFIFTGTLGACMIVPSANVQLAISALISRRLSIKYSATTNSVDPESRRQRLTFRPFTFPSKIGKFGLLSSIHAADNIPVSSGVVFSMCVADC